jgi:hypothetical protein
MRTAAPQLLCQGGAIDQPGVADVEMNPATADAGEDPTDYATVATGIVWRAQAILAADPGMASREIPQTRRRKLARAGVSGWTWTMVSVDPSQVKAKSPPLGGTHATPRWHIRRGHWRTIADGRRVFVRECEVPSRAQIAKLELRLAHIHEPRFVLNSQSLVRDCDLIVLDEVSMVGEEMANDLLAFGKPT